MRFQSAASRMQGELENRLELRKNVLRWGISYLDDALDGIFANDLVLLGAPPGVGKTALCTGIAHTNLLDGKKVHFIALEAHEYEIERRIKFKYLSQIFFADQNRPRLDGPLNFKSWYRGRFDEQLKRYSDQVEDFCTKAFTDLFTLYKTSKFTVTDLITQVSYAANDTDLVIVDHAHYFDWDDDNDNRALKKIVHAARNLSHEIGRPIILVAHLRKKDRTVKELCAGMDDFHGSSELAKVATKCVTIAPGDVTADKRYITYFRASKDRMDQGPSRYLGVTTFNPKKGWYDDEYKIAWANQTADGELAREQYPDWARTYRESSNGHSLPAGGGPRIIRATRRTGAFTKVYVPD